MKTIKMRFIDLVMSLFKRGLGELYVLHRNESQVFLGHLVFEKGKLYARDEGLLSGLKPAQLDPCWDSGLLGMVCYTTGQEWESMTYLGINHCNVPIDLSTTRQGALLAAETQYGEKLADFVGSIYRGYQIMLDHHFLPVVLLKEISGKGGERGLAVSDLRMVPMDLSIIRKINDLVRRSVDKYLVIDINDVEIDKEKFNQLFANYVKD